MNIHIALVGEFLGFYKILKHDDGELNSIHLRMSHGYFGVERGNGNYSPGAQWQRVGVLITV